YVEGKKIKSLFFKNLPSVKARIVDIPVIIELANEDLLFIQYQGTDNEIKNYRLNLKQHEKNFNIFKIVIAILLISLIPFCIFLWFNLDLKNKMDFTKFNIERSRVKENKKSDIIDNSDKTLNYNEENKIENIEKYSPKYTIESLNDIVNQNNPLYFVKDKAILQPGEIDKLKFILDYLQNYSKVEMSILGHTESIDKPKNEHKLSTKRAEYIKKIFKEKFPDKEFIFRPEGFGATKIAILNATKKERYLNRRVELKVISVD
ncbi:MAG: OmpA family protein, partial [Spirochaetes bacterium]|nr:OmpA family protein [Spirochaetota bacterium]